MQYCKKFNEDEKRWEKIQLIVVYWYCILQAFWTCLLALTVVCVCVCMDSSGFSIYKMTLSAKRDNFIFSYSVWMYFYFFPCLTALVKTSLKCHIKMATVDILDFPYPRGKTFCLSSVSMMLAIGFFVLYNLFLALSIDYAL